MRPLSATDIVSLWERVQGLHPIDRALTLLAVGCPEKSQLELAALSIGQRDACLLTLRELTLGSQLDSVAECPKCQERLEFSLNVADIRLIDSEALLPQFHHCTIDGIELQFRLPNSLDLAAVIAEGKPDATQLVQRCLIQANHRGQPVNIAELPAATIAHLKTELMETDPQAEILLDLACPACNHQWQILFDIVEFFWIELAAQAKRLLREVHLLALAYGWREADILAMSVMRRQYYLDLIS